MDKQNKTGSKFIAAGLFGVAAVFSFSTKNSVSQIAGFFFVAAALFYLYSGISGSGKNGLK